MHFAVVFDLFVALDLDKAAVFQLEAVERAFEVGFLHQHALEGGGVEAESGAALEALFVGVAVDVLEVFVRVVGGDVGGLGDGAVDPALGGGLHVDVFFGADVVGGDEVVGQLGGRVFAEGHGLGVDQFAVGQQLEAEDVDLFLGLLAFADDVAAVVVRERGLDAVGGIVGQRQADGAGGRDGTVVGKARANVGQFFHQFRGHRGDALHVATVFGVQYLAGDVLAQLPAVLRHFRALAQHLGGHGEAFFHDRGGALFAGELQGHFPAGDGHVAGDAVGEVQRRRAAVLHAKHGHGAAQAEEAHAVAALAQDLVLLLLQGQPVHFDHVVEHAGEHAHDFLVFLPVERGLVGEGVAHEVGEVDRTQQAGAVGRQRLFAAGIGGADLLAPPVVVHLVDLVDQDEARLGKVVGGDHDHVPQMPGADVAVDLAGHQTVVAADVVGVGGPFAPDHLLGVVYVEIADFFLVDREHQRPVGVGLDRLHETIGDQQRQVELAQAPVLALGADEVAHVRMGDVESAHLRAATAAGRGHGEAHLVVDIHEGHRAGGVGAGAGHERAARTQGAEFIADAAARLQGEAGFVHFFEDAVHRVGDGARHGAVDGGRGRLVFQRARIRGDAAGGNGAAAQRPEEAFIPVLLLLAVGLGVGQRAGDALIGAVDIGIDVFALFGLEPVFLVPDIPGRRLHGNFRSGARFRDRFKTHSAHQCFFLEIVADATSPRPVVLIAGSGAPAPRCQRIL